MAGDDNHKLLKYRSRKLWLQNINMNNRLAKKPIFKFKMYKEYFK